MKSAINQQLSVCVCAGAKSRGLYNRLAGGCYLQIHDDILPAIPTCAFYLFIRVMEITDILSQNVPLEDVQYLAGHSNPSGHTVL